MIRRTRVKICGITRQQDANLAQALGADSLGFVFVPASKRYLCPESAAGIVEQLQPFVTPVGLFLDADAAEVRRVLTLMPTLVPQFHGRETPEYCEGFGRTYLKAIGVGSAGLLPTQEQLAPYRRALGFLFDSHEPGQLGGTGHAFDWSQLGARMSKPLILAGGLNAQNVEQAIRQVKPFAVDVSSGVEQAKGIKDPKAMQTFMAVVHQADQAVDAPSIDNEQQGI